MMNDDIDEKLYTVQELAASNRLRISKTTIWREIAEGNLSYYKLRGQIFIGDHHIREYLRKCENRRNNDSDFMNNSFFDLATSNQKSNELFDLWAFFENKI